MSAGDSIFQSLAPRCWLRDVLAGSVRRRWAALSLASGLAWACSWQSMLSTSHLIRYYVCDLDQRQPNARLELLNRRGEYRGSVHFELPWFIETQAQLYTGSRLGKQPTGRQQQPLYERCVSWIPDESGASENEHRGVGIMGANAVRLSDGGTRWADSAGSEPFDSVLRTAAD
ncbi:hypothetical protein J7T55_010905 [Diaporthe amygdali]|uniref:uncharacterized protein n=1 Tax=Phomopsis amygdali TaxID=1214568 RepID=UPI0022FEBC1B|nr:uncharacterized protein J7T55_010905 [Diaporthe amygdali]KAJ0104439.1 hypothetical protein J7T55_010905 [Diaporthe amygdali]